MEGVLAGKRRKEKCGFPANKVDLCPWPLDLEVDYSTQVCVLEFKKRHLRVEKNVVRIVFYACVSAYLDGLHAL